MKYLILPLIILSVSACDPFRMIAPRTVAGFESGGVLGALDGATGAILAKCETLDGVTVRVAVDGIADLTEQTDNLEDIRDLRQEACNHASLVKGLVAAGE